METPSTDLRSIPVKIDAVHREKWKNLLSGNDQFLTNLELMCDPNHIFWISIIVLYLILLKSAYLWVRFLFGVFSFKFNYPNWEPDGDGNHLMSVLADFRLRNEESDHAVGQSSSSVCKSPNQLRPSGAPVSSPRTGASLNTHSVNLSVQDRVGLNVPFVRPTLMDRSYSMLRCDRVAESSVQMYWLDKFYTTSQSRQNLESGGLLLDIRHTGEDGVSMTDRYGSRYGGIDASGLPSIRGDEIERLNRVGMHLQTSTRGGIFENQGSGQVAAGESRWWARRGTSSCTPGESSFQPPTFVRGVHIVESRDDFYDSEEDFHERDWSSQRHIKRTFGSSQISELDDGSLDLELPFGDVYQRPREF